HRCTWPLPRSPLAFALALTFCQGHAEVVVYLLDECHVDPAPRDRWGHTPAAEAALLQHTAVVQLLRRAEMSRSQSPTPQAHTYTGTPPAPVPAPDAA